MRNLAAQLHLDIAQAWTPRQALGLVVFAVVFFVLGGRDSGVQMAVPVLAMIGLLAATGPFIADRAVHLDQLYGQLPTTRRPAVTSHYLIGALAFAASAVVAIGFAALVGPQLNQSIPVALAAVGAVATLTALSIPAIVRFGPQAMMFVSFGLVSLVMIVIKLLPWAQPALAQFAIAAIQRPGLTGVIVMGALILLWALSYAVTTALYRRLDL